MKLIYRLIKKIFSTILNPSKYFRIVRYKLTCWNEKRKGIDFTQMASISELNLPQNSWGYETSGNIYLKKVINTFNISQEDSILDIGSGKGHVLKVLNKYSFKKVDGIEFSQYLSKVAIRNFEILNIKKIKIYNTNAAIFSNYKEYNFYYLFNPFHSEIMKEVITKIEESLITSPRKVIIIYKNPMCHENIVKSGIFKKINEFKSENKGIIFFIYQNITN